MVRSYLQEVKCKKMILCKYFENCIVVCEPHLHVSCYGKFELRFLYNVIFCHVFKDCVRQSYRLGNSEFINHIMIRISMKGNEFVIQHALYTPSFLLIISMPLPSLINGILRVMALS